MRAGTTAPSQELAEETEGTPQLTDSELGLPVMWRILPLRSLCLKTELADPSQNPGLSFQYIDVSAVSNTLWRITGSTRHTGESAPSRARKVLRTRDVIFATVRPTLRRVAIVPEDFDGQLASTAFCVLRADPSQADPRFVYYSLLTEDFTARMGNLQQGASYPTVSDGVILGQKIPVPPLPEQRATAAVLSMIQAAVDVQEEIVATLKELKAATIAKLFREGLRGEPLKQTEIGEIPLGWNVMPLRSLLSEPLRNGHSAKEVGDGNGVRTLTLTAVTKRDFSIAKTKITAAEPSRVQDLWIRDGDIFVERANTFEMVGLAALYRGSERFAIFPDLLIRVRVDTDQLIPDVLAEWLLLPWCRSHFQKNCRGAATSMPKIDHQTVEDTLVPVPPMSEQGDMTRVIRYLGDRMVAASKRLESVRNLFASVLGLLMTGRLRVPPRMIARLAARSETQRLKGSSKPVDEAVVQEIVRRIVEAVVPEKIILFGSAARGEMGPDSDLDFLVVKRCEDPLQVAREVYRRLRGVGAPKDIVVVTPEDIERERDTIGYIIRPALREGRVVYAA